MTGAAFLLALLLPGLSAAAAPADPELARLVEPVLDQDAARPGGPLLERGAAERDPAHGRRQLLPSARLGDGGLSIRRRWDDRGDLDGPLERQTSQGHQARREGEIVRPVRRVGISGEATGIQSRCRAALRRAAGGGHRESESSDRGTSAGRLRGSSRKRDTKSRSAIQEGRSR